VRVLVDESKLAAILASEQFDADCKAEFALFDRRGDGILPKEVLAQVLKHLHASISHLFPNGLSKPTVRDIVKVVESFNEDASGALTYSEFKRFCATVLRNLVQQVIT
jgi:Ca2+-binding EF-hand superfamily protein